MNTAAANQRSQPLASYPARLSLAQVAAYLNCSDDLAGRLVKNGALAAVNVAAPGAKRTCFRVAREALAEFEAKRKF